MKRIIFMATIITLVSVAPHSLVALSLDIGGLVPIDPNACMSFSSCSSKLTTRMPCCCATGTTEYSCPSGWTVNGTICTRSSTTSSDTSGEYTAEYGTCDATAVVCYELMPSGSTEPDGSPCRCKSSL